MKVDLPALRSAIATLRAHESLLKDSMLNLRCAHWDKDAIEDVVSAIAHVVDDDYRSPETPAGS